MKEFIIRDRYEDLDNESKLLTQKAKEAAPNAYAPYSHFCVGAAVLLEDGTVVTGTNQENAAYPSGMCAERVALYNTISRHPGKSIKKISVVAMRMNENELVPATSCGSCRQVMLEFEHRQTTPIAIVMQNEQHQWIIAPSAESLLPFCFSRSALDR